MKRRVLASDKELKTPIQKPRSTTWGASISPTDIPVVLNGFRPEEMEDKWFIYADGPDSQGKAVVHMHRSWTGYEVVELKLALALGEDGGFKEEDARVTDITWETEESIYAGPTDKEEEMKGIAAEICLWVLNVKLNTPS